jgi:hypothetical protein
MNHVPGHSAILTFILTLVCLQGYALPASAEIIRLDSIPLVLPKSLVDDGVPPSSLTLIAQTSPTDGSTVSDSVVRYDEGQTRKEQLTGPNFVGQVDLVAGNDVAVAMFAGGTTAEAPQPESSRPFLFARATDFQILSVSYADDFEGPRDPIPLIISYSHHIEASGESLDLISAFRLESMVAILDSTTFEGVPVESPPGGVPALRSDTKGPFISFMTSGTQVSGPPVGVVEFAYSESLLAAEDSFVVAPGVAYWIILESTVILQRVVGDGTLKEFFGYAFSDPVFTVDPKFEFANQVTIARSFLTSTESPVPAPAAGFLLLAGLSALSLLRISRRGLPGGDSVGR